VIKLLKAFRMPRLVAHIENIENVHLSTPIKPKISLNTEHKKKSNEKEMNGKQ
jgi:hypothetical protein